MNKKNKILVGCLALLLVLSVGYALFSDTITINGTATAKGNFELTTTCDINELNAQSGIVTDANITCEDNVVNASATLGAPGSVKWFRIKVKNTGSIPARIKEIKELNNPETYFCNKDECNGQIENSSFIKTEEGRSSLYSEFYQDIAVYDDYSSNYEFHESLAYLFDEATFDAVLDPNETAYFYIHMWWVHDSNVQTLEPLVAEMNVEMTWEQVTQ